MASATSGSTASSPRAPLDVAIDAVGVAPYDLAAVKLIVEEAGGTFTDRHGAATHESDTAISSNGRFHAEVIARLRG